MQHFFRSSTAKEEVESKFRKFLEVITLPGAGSHLELIRLGRTRNVLKKMKIMASVLLW